MLEMLQLNNLRCKDCPLSDYNGEHQPQIMSHGKTAQSVKNKSLSVTHTIVPTNASQKTRGKCHRVEM